MRKFDNSCQKLSCFSVLRENTQKKINHIKVHQINMGMCEKKFNPFDPIDNMIINLLFLVEWYFCTKNSRWGFFQMLPKIARLTQKNSSNVTFDLDTQIGENKLCFHKAHISMHLMSKFHKHSF